jgi:hypothetical protein
MALAEVADMVRFGAPNTTPQEQANAQAFLELAEEWVKDLCGRDWDLTGPTAQSFSNRRQGDLLMLKDEFATSSGMTVTGYISPTDAGRVLGDFEWVLEEGGRLRLRIATGIQARSPSVIQPRRPGISGALDAIDHEAVWSYDRLTVAWSASGIVPKAVRDGVAMVAAATMLQAPADAGGLKSENIGDYSYTRDDKRSIGSLVMPSAAGELLALHAATPNRIPGIPVRASGQLVW